MNYPITSAVTVPGSSPDAEAAKQVLAALEGQARELTRLLWRLERARNVLVPSAIQSWRGLTKLAFDSALGGLTVTLDDGIATIRSAIESTRSAIAELRAGMSTGG